MRSLDGASGVAVRARGLSKIYGRGELAFHALKGVDLDLRRGETAMLVGPSGSGKTTLLSILGCVLEPTSGELHVLGHDLSRATARELVEVRRKLIGFVFQGFNLIPALSARDNVALPLRLLGQRPRTARAEADELLAQVGLADKRDKGPEELSGGQRQRVAVARALAGSPPIILADEPTASLDAHSGLQVTTLLTELAKKRGASVLVVSHDNRIFHLADRLVHIEDGRLVEPGIAA
ncbi:ABC transporter ATP-binding protein [Myxococcota bacterium]|nr:ABC transporter ATP-binding protein [Myxococcota bacterium]